jgi:hypothetical protein
VKWDLLNTQMAKAADAVVAYDEDTLRQCVSHLLPSFRWSESVQTDNVVALRRNESGEK